jgi:hypothetical protein
MSICQFRVNDKLRDEFKEYCENKGTTMSKVLTGYITTLLSNKHVYCDCGTSISDMSPLEILAHGRICKRTDNE